METHPQQAVKRCSYCIGLPFTESGAMLIDAILNRSVPPPSKVSPAVSPKLEAVILKALQKDPKQRYQRAEEMNADLALLHSGQSVQRKHALERRLKVMTRIAWKTGYPRIAAI